MTIYILLLVHYFSRGGYLYGGLNKFENMLRTMNILNAVIPEGCTSLVEAIDAEQDLKIKISVEWIVMKMRMWKYKTFSLVNTFSLTGMIKRFDANFQGNSCKFNENMVSNVSEGIQSGSVIHCQKNFADGMEVCDKKS